MVYSESLKSQVEYVDNITDIEEDVSELCEAVSMCPDVAESSSKIRKIPLISYHRVTARGRSCL